MKARVEPGSGRVKDTAASSRLAATITKSASRQTYYTIRLLVDRPRVADAYRAYAYFRWVDDTLDAGPAPSAPTGEAERSERLAFLGRQQALLDAALAGRHPEDITLQESMLVDLVAGSGPADVGLHSYLRQMMRVMAFDVARRGHLVSAAELDAYTRSLAIAVTDAMHHFIGHGSGEPGGPDRYRPGAGAHILHMLRDTETDLAAGYFNVPREVLEAASIGPKDVRCAAYRRWVRGRVEEAQDHLRAGQRYFARLRSRRHRLAGLAYIARFTWLIEQLERDDFQVRPAYPDAPSRLLTLRTAWTVASAVVLDPGLPTRRRVPLPEIGGHR
jgi:phytoene/squalene synthetase